MKKQSRSDTDSFFSHQAFMLSWWPRVYKTHRNAPKQGCSFCPKNFLYLNSPR